MISAITNQLVGPILSIAIVVVGLRIIIGGRRCCRCRRGCDCHRR